MEDDHLLKALAKIGKSRDEERDQLDALLETERNEHSEYRWKTAEVDSPSEVVQRVKRERDRLEPYNDDFRTALVRKISESLQSDGTVENNLVDLDAKRRKVGKTVAVSSLVTLMLAAAAALALVLLPGQSAVQLPNYTLTVQSGLKDIRGESTDPQTIPQFQEHAILDILLRPQTPLPTEIQLKTYLERNGQIRSLTVPYEGDPSGSLHLRGTVGETIAIPPGTWTMWFAIAPQNRTLQIHDVQESILQGNEGALDWGLLLRTKIRVLE